MASDVVKDTHEVHLDAEGSGKVVRGKTRGGHAAEATIRLRHVALFAYLLMAVPIAVFFFGWIRWYYALVCTLAMAGGLTWLYRADYLKNREELGLPWKHLIGIGCFIGLWVLFSGNCGFGAGLYDIPWRNVILSDLINYSWPVYYDSGYALSYYVVFWMIPALAGKAFGWGVALAVMWLYETCICTAAVLLVAFLLKAKKVSTFWTIAVVFVLWSGLNLLGQCFMQMWGRNYYEFGMNNNESYCDNFYNGESTNFYYRSNADCIEESYNQIVVWLAVPLFLQNRKMHSFIFIDLLLMPFSPWAALGLVPLMIVMGVLELKGYLKEDGGRVALKKTLAGIFSPANLLALVGILIVFAAFFSTGTRLSGTAEGATAATGPAGILTLSKFRLSNWAAYLVFVFCEFGAFALLIRKRYKKDPFFWANIVWLCLVPFLWVGSIEGRDFCMNASLPGLFILMIYMIGYLVHEVWGKPLGFKNLLIVMTLVIAFASPVLEMCNQVEIMYANKSLWTVMGSTELTTFDGAELHSINNFVCSEPADTLFFEQVARVQPDSAR